MKIERENFICVLMKDVNFYLLFLTFDKYMEIISKDQYIKQSYLISETKFKTMSTITNVTIWYLICKIFLLEAE